MINILKEMAVCICFFVQVLILFIYGFTNVSLPVCFYLLVWVASSAIAIYLIGDKNII